MFYVGRQAGTKITNPQLANN